MQSLRCQAGLLRPVWSLGESGLEIQPGHPGTNVDGEESEVDGTEQGGGGQRSGRGFECKARPWPSLVLVEIKETESGGTGTPEATESLKGLAGFGC